MFTTLTNQQCQQARLSRDARFDGQFFTAVKTTGIFCRPVCPATPPKEENVEYFFNAAIASKAGYRPCLRCRPDSAPGSWAWHGSKTTFHRALSLIEQGALQHQSLPHLAERLGISDRYVRQLFTKHLGMSPKQYALVYQLMFAKQLLHDSNLSISDLAFASGFNSIRRFNDAFQKTLKLTPSDVRRGKQKTDSNDQVRLSCRTPLNWSHMLDFYRARQVDGVENIDKNSYSRHIRLKHGHGWFKLEMASANHLIMTFKMSDLTELRTVILKVRRMFDLDVYLDPIEQQLGEAGLPIQPGIHIPGTWDAWEAGLRAILGQQVSVKAAITQLNRLIALTQHDDTQTQQPPYFPEPTAVAALDLREFGVPNSRRETLKRFAIYMSENRDAHPSEWLALKGIGPWTINYACLRGLSEPDCFLSGDLVVKKALANLPQIDVNAFSPWGSYATFQCWSQQS